MTTSLTAGTVCEIDEMNPIGVNDGEGSGTALGICTRIVGVVAELEDVTRLPERRLFKIGPVPFLHSLTRQSCTESLM